VQPQTIEIKINGNAAFIPEGQNVEALLDRLGVQSDRVAVEVDRHIVGKRDWAATAIANGAEIEIVEFVGGG
jgi:thiamine biosynthesis protein ThiS